MSKTICKLDKSEIGNKQTDVAYYCRKCGAEARKEKHLCKPKKIKEDTTE